MRNQWTQNIVTAAYQVPKMPLEMSEPIAANAQGGSAHPASVLITVAICTRNRCKSLEAAIQSVIPQLTSQTELLIIDNGSTDETRKQVELLQERDARIRYKVELRPGIARARNAALLNAAGTYVLFLDDDELAMPGWVDEYLKFLESSSDRRIGSAGGPYIARHTVPTPRWVRPDFGIYDLGRGEGPLPPGETLAGGNSAYHRARVLDLGGFAEALLRSDDSEINLRLQKAGWDVWWLPKATVYHVMGPDRFRVRNQLKVAFREGKDRATLTAAEFSSRSKYAIYVALRMLVAPAHFLALIFASLVQLCLGKVAYGVESLVKISRYLGMMGQWLKPEHWRTCPGRVVHQRIPNGSVDTR